MVCYTEWAWLMLACEGGADLQHLQFFFLSRFDKDDLVLITARANGRVELLKFRKVSYNIKVN